MSFAVSCRRTGLEYSSRGANGFFAQRQNMVKPSHLFLLRKRHRAADGDGGTQVCGFRRQGRMAVCGGDRMIDAIYARNFGVALSTDPHRLGVVITM